MNLPEAPQAPSLSSSSSSSSHPHLPCPYCFPSLFGTHRACHGLLGPACLPSLTVSSCCQCLHQCQALIPMVLPSVPPFPGFRVTWSPCSTGTSTAHAQERGLGQESSGVCVQRGLGFRELGVKRAHTSGYTGLGCAEGTRAEGAVGQHGCMYRGHTGWQGVCRGSMCEQGQCTCRDCVRWHCAYGAVHTCVWRLCWMGQSVHTGACGSVCGCWGAGQAQSVGHRQY